MRCGKSFGKRYSSPSSQRPCNLARHSDAGDKLDLDRIALEETKRPFQLQAAMRVVDHCRGLKAAASVDESVRSQRIALELTANIWAGRLLHDVVLWRWLDAILR